MQNELLVLAKDLSTSRHSSAYSPTARQDAYWFFRSSIVIHMVSSCAAGSKCHPKLIYRVDHSGSQGQSTPNFEVCYLGENYSYESETHRKLHVQELIDGLSHSRRSG